MQGKMLNGLKGQMANLLECSGDPICSSTATAGSLSKSGSLGDWGHPDEASCGWVSLWLILDGRAVASTYLAAAMHQLCAQDLGIPGHWAYLWSCDCE